MGSSPRGKRFTLTVLVQYSTVTLTNSSSSSTSSSSSSSSSSSATSRNSSTSRSGSDNGKDKDKKVTRPRDPLKGEVPKADKQPALNPNTPRIPKLPKQQRSKSGGSYVLSSSRTKIWTGATSIIHWQMLWIYPKKIGTKHRGRTQRTSISSPRW